MGKWLIWTILGGSGSHSAAVDMSTCMMMWTRWMRVRRAPCMYVLYKNDLFGELRISGMQSRMLRLYRTTRKDTHDSMNLWKLRF